MSGRITNEENYRRTLERIFRQIARINLDPIPEEFIHNRYGNSTSLPSRYEIMQEYERHVLLNVQWQAQAAMRSALNNDGPLYAPSMYPFVHEMQTPALYMATNLYSFNALYKPKWHSFTLYVTGDVMLDIHGYRPLTYRIFTRDGETFSNVAVTLFLEFEYEFQITMSNYMGSI